MLDEQALYVGVWMICVLVVLGAFLTVSMNIVGAYLCLRYGISTPYAILAGVLLVIFSPLPTALPALTYFEKVL